jgi:hypothetical protein
LRAGRPRSQVYAMPKEVHGWYSRGYLPHYDAREKLQSITYRLCDALPATVLSMLEEMEPDDARRRKMIESHLDAGYGSCLLRERTNAEIVVRGWRHFDCVRYRLHVWCVMPTHVHVLIVRLASMPWSISFNCKNPTRRRLSSGRILGPRAYAPH